MDVAVVGSVNIDLVASVVRLPLPGETVHALGFEQFFGGKGSNQAVAAARLGRHVAFVGLTGADAEGGAVRAALTAEGIDVTHLGVTAEAGTGRAIVVVAQDAENSIVVVGGANAVLGERQIADATDLLDDAAVVVAQLEVPVGTVLAAARAAAGTFVLNPAPAQELPRELLDLVDVLVVNEVEYEVVLGRPLPEDLTEVPAHVAESGLRCTVVVTLGGRGAALCHDGVVVTEVPPQVPVVDTTGAGDTFIGALADALSRHEDPHAALRWAVHAASLSVGSLGATTGMPTPAQVAASVGRAAPTTVPPTPVPAVDGPAPAEEV
ncbi:ribokinase [Actinotalea ferrariae CF5-4]|uniref:Ribokinase n=1 Tax=Actinotalea ferrariae CF5-4 TaxID=948458 RepID=A0A021VV14_9CELL|nr:ribokinase [Actinotalea ferrariae CF5-4]